MNGLTDEEIKHQIRDSPAKIKKRSKALLKKLEKLGVHLDSEGNVDLSSVPYGNLRKELESNPQVKIALMQQSLDFEFPHKEHMNEKARQIKARLEAVEAERERAVEDRIAYI